MGQEASSCKPIEAPKVPRAREEAENLLPQQQALLTRLGLSASRVDEELRRYLEEALHDTEATPPRSHVIVIRAPWGYGKTHYGKHVVPRIASSLGMHYVYVTLEEVIERIRDRFIEETRGAPLEYDKLNTVAEPIVRDALRDIILGAAQEAEKRGAKAAVVFIDELEAVLEAAQHRTQKTIIRSYLASLLLNELLSAIRLLMHSEASSPYADAVGKVHLVLAATPEAFNTIMSLAEKMGIGGRLARRIDTVTLRPLSKSDTLKIVKTLIEDYYGLPASAWSPGIVNAIHAASGGNTGIVIRIVNLLLHEAGVECRQLYGRDCICSLEDPVLLARLMQRIELSYTPRGSYEALVNRDLASIAVQHAEDFGETALARLVAYLEPLSPDDVYAYQAVLADHGVRLYPVRLYKGSYEKVAAVLDRAARRLADRAQASISDARAAVDELLYIGPGDDYTVYVPVNAEDYAEVAFLFSSQGLRVSNEAIREAIAELEQAAYEQGLDSSEAYMVKPSTIPVLYPPAAVRAIPVIRDPEAAARLYKEVRELRITMPREYGELVAKGLQIVLNTPSSIDTPKDAVKTTLTLNIYGTSYQVNALIEYYEQGHPLFAVDPKKLNPEAPTVIIRAYSPPGVKPPQRVRSKAHQTLDVELTPRDAETLAALAYALLEKHEEYRNLVDRYAVEDLARRMKEQVESQKERLAESYRENGIAVPPLLTASKKTQEEFLNSYRLLLFAADNRGIVDLEEAVQLLYHGYRVRPYKGRSRRWCGTEVPPIVILDLEAEDHRAYYDEEKRKRYLDRLRESLLSLLREAQEAGLARAEATRYRLIPHPVERRLNELSTRLGIGLEEAERYFLLPSDPMQRKAAKDAFNTIARIAEARLEAMRKPSQHDLAKLQEAAAAARRLGAEQLRCLSDGVGDAAYLAILKEKGAKLIEPSTLAETAEYFLQASSRHHLAPLMAPLLLYYTELISKGLSKASTSVDDLVRSAYSVLRDAEAVVAALKELGATDVKIGEAIREISSKEAVCREVAAIVSKTLKLHDDLTRIPPSSFSKSVKPEKLMQELRFDNCGNKYNFMPLLYYLEEDIAVKRDIEDAKSTLESMKNAINEVKKTLEALPNDALPEAQKLLNAALGKPLIVDMESPLISILEKLRKDLEDLRDKYITCMNIRKKARSLLNEAEDVLDDTLKAINEARSLAGKARLLAERTGLVEHVKAFESYIANLDDAQEKLEEAHNNINRLYDVVTDTPCTMLDELSNQERHAESLLRYAKEIRRRVKELEERIEEEYNELRDKLMAKLRHLQSTADRIEKLLSVTDNAGILDVGTAAEVRKALEEYRFYERLYMDIVGLKRLDEDPEQVLSKARSWLNEAYHSLRQAIVRDIGEDAYRVLEYLLQKPLSGKERLSKAVQEISKATGIPAEKVIESMYVLDLKGYAALYLAA